MTNMKLSANATACLLILNARGYSEEKARELSRFRVTRNSIRRISGWNRLSAPFMEELAQAMAEYGWFFLEFNDTEFAAIQIDKVGSWVRLGSSRVSHYRKKDDAEESIYDDFYDAFPFDDSTVEED